MLKGKYHIVIMNHSFIRAAERGIDPDLLEQTLQSGQMKKFGKNRVKIEKRFKKFTIRCVDEIIGNVIKIVTITKKVKR